MAPVAPAKRGEVLQVLQVLQSPSTQNTSSVEAAEQAVDPTWTGKAAQNRPVTAPATSAKPITDTSQEVGPLKYKIETSQGSGTTFVARDELRRRSPATWVLAQSSVEGALEGQASLGPWGAVNFGLNGAQECEWVLPLTSLSPRSGDPRADISRPLGLLADGNALYLAPPLPGSEFTVRERKGGHLGVAAGKEFMGAGVAAGVDADDQTGYAKHARFLKDNQVEVTIDTADRLTLSAGLTAGLPGTKTREGQSDTILEEGASSPKREGVGFSAHAAHSETSSRNGKVTLDLSDPVQAHLYTQIMTAPAEDAIALIERSQGQLRATEEKGDETGLSLGFPGFKLLSRNTYSYEQQVDETGPAGTSHVEGSTFGTAESGLLQKEARTLELYQSTAANGGGEVGVSLSVKNDTFNPDDAQQFNNFATAMGLDSSVRLPTTGPAEGTPGTYSLELKLTQANLDALKGCDPNTLRKAYAQALAALGPAPGWDTQPQTFHDAKQAFREKQKSYGGLEVQKEYKRQTGSGLGTDMASDTTMREVDEQLRRAGLSSVLEAIGTASPVNMKALLMAVKQVAGAEVINLDATVGGTAVGGGTQGPSARRFTER